MPRKYFFNIEKIKKDSHEKFYWLGFLAGDGSVQEQGRRLRIELKDDSLDILNHFRDFMESNANITSRINNNGCHCSRIDINSKELGEYLAEYNIVPNKTKTFKIPEDTFLTKKSYATFLHILANTLFALLSRVGTILLNSVPFSFLKVLSVS